MNNNLIYLTIPTICPICGGDTKISISASGVKTLICTNPSCSGKFLYQLDHFCSKKGLDIKGLSESTLEKLSNQGWLNSLTDIYKLKEHKNEWVAMPGFGVTSVEKILKAIEESRECPLDKFIAALGIPLVGNKVAKIIAEKVKRYDIFSDMVKDRFDFSQWDGFGEVMSEAILNFDYSEANELSKYLTILNAETEDEDSNKVLDGLTICITGKLKRFKSRAKIVELIEKYGGKATDSVSKKTTLLITNDINSGTSKVVTATRLGIPMLTEEEFLNHYNLEGEF